MDRVRSHVFQDEWEGKNFFVEVEGNGVRIFFSFFFAAVVFSFRNAILKGILRQITIHLT